jgi:hypothetical protein
MTDTPEDLTDDDLEQLAQSLAVDGSLGRADAVRVVETLRELGRCCGDLAGFCSRWMKVYRPWGAGRTTAYRRR